MANERGYAVREHHAEPFDLPALAAAAPVSASLYSKGAAVTRLERWILRRILDVLGHPPFAIALWNGEEIRAFGTVARSALMIRSRAALYRLCLNPHVFLGELYARGDIDVRGDLGVFLQDAFRAYETALARRPYLVRVWRERRPRRGSEEASRAHIRHHYDLGDGFYQLWLDHAAMQYTCGYYPRPGMSLEAAQIAKMHHICRKLRLQPGETVVEAGCGWGGLALFMARTYGVTVTAYNLSKRQIEYARKRAADQGLAERVMFIEDDYRNIRGHYDAFVSVGMLEHVGAAHYRAFGSVIDRCLKDHGRGLIHCIGRNQAYRVNSWVEKRIFPGTYAPTLREIMEVLEPHALSVLDIENLRLHYVRTLCDWLARFEHHAERVGGEHGEEFVRAWRLYLCGSIASFTTGWLQVFQVAFSRPGLNDLPASRAYLYAASPPHADLGLQ